MQDNKQKDQSPDDDILQSKADLRELLKAAGLPDSDKTPRSEAHLAAASSADSNIPEEILLDAELLDFIEDGSFRQPDPPSNSANVSAPKNSQSLKPDPDSGKPDAPALSTANDNLHHHKPAVHLYHAVDTPVKPQESPILPETHALVERLQQALQKAEKELWEKSRLLERQQQRLGFLEQQLQNAVVLERAKSQYQQEVEKLKLDNQQLTAEIAQLKHRLEDLYGSDAQVQGLRGELEAVQSALSEQHILAAQVNETMQVLQNELAAYKQKVHESETKQRCHEQQLADMKAEHKRLQKDRQQIIDDKNSESAEALRQKETELQKTAAQVEELRGRYHRLEGDFDQIRHEYEAFQTQANEEIRMLTESTDVLTDENARLSDEIHQVEAQKQQLIQTLKKLQAGEHEILRLGEQFRQERQLSDDLRQQIEQFQSRLSHVQQEKDELVEQLHTFQSTENHLREEIEQLRDAAADMDVLQEKLDESHHEIRRLNEENQLLQKQLDELQTASAGDRLPEPAPEPIYSSIEPAEQHLDDQDGDDGIPVFNLADQIMDAHRRSVAGRRRRVTPAVAAPQTRSIKDVIAQYIPSSEPPSPPVDSPTGSSHSFWTDSSLTPFQREILREIVRRDLESDSRNRYIMTDYSSMHN